MAEPRSRLRGKRSQSRQTSDQRRDRSRHLGEHSSGLARTHRRADQKRLRVWRRIGSARRVQSRRTRSDDESQRDALIKRSFPEWLEKKPAYLTPIVRWRGLLGKDFLDAGKWPQPPDIFEIAKGTEPQRAALEAWMELGTGSKVFTLPPGVPADAYQALKKSSRPRSPIQLSSKTPPRAAST